MTLTLPLTPIQEAWNIPSMNQNINVQQNNNPYLEKDNQIQLLKNPHFNENSKINPYDTRYYSNYTSHIIEPGYHLPNIIHVPIDREPVIRKLITYDEPQRRNVVNDILETHLKPANSNNNGIINKIPNSTPKGIINTIPNSTPNVEFFENNYHNNNNSNEDIMSLLFLLLIFIFIERIMFIFCNS